METMIYTEEEEKNGYVMHGNKRYKIIKDKNGKIKGEVYDPENRRVTDRMTLFLTDEEVKSLLDCASKKGDLATKYLAMIQLMLYSGLRRENVVELKWSQLDLDKKLINLEGVDVKTGMKVAVPIWDETVGYLKILKGNKSDDGNVFMHATSGKSGSKRKYTFAQINNIVGTLGREANIQPKNNFKNINPHLLRHTWVRLCKKRGVRKDVLQIWGGWSSQKMIDEVYGQPDIEDVQSEYEKLKGDGKNV